MNAIEVVNVSKVYRRYARKKQFATLKSALLKGSLIRDLQPDETFPALRGVSFSVPKGCTYGIIGRNGSGKSTLLKCVAGITRPNEGTVTVDGRISALIELGAGFHPEISGRENVFINGIMLGLSKREIQRRFDEIVEFAELKDFIDAPVKTYSSGHVHASRVCRRDPRRSRRAADRRSAGRRRSGVHRQVPRQVRGVPAPQQDDSAGDALARSGREVLRPRAVAGQGQDARRRRAEARRRGLSDRRRKGRGSSSWRRDEAAADGAVSAARARRTVGAELADQPVRRRDDARPTCSGDRRTLGIARGRDHRRHARSAPDGTPATCSSPATRWRSGSRRARISRRKDFVFGIGLFNADGVCCYGTNTNIEELEPAEISGDGEIRFRIDSLELVEGTYKIDVAAHKLDGYPYDYHRLLYTFRVKSRTKDVGIYRPEHRWEFTPNIRFKHQDRARSGTGTRIEALSDGALARGGGRLGRGCGAQGARSSSPTACSICFIPATCATCRRRGASATR